MAGLLVVCGLGCEPERDATLEALAALASCGARYSTLSPARRKWLAARVGKVSPAPKAEAVARAARNSRVGLAVWGHATLTSEYAREVLAAAEKLVVETVVLGSLSPAGAGIGESARSLGWRPDEDDGWTVLPYGESPAWATASGRSSLRGRRRPLAAFSEKAEALILGLPAGKR